MTQPFDNRDWDLRQIARKDAEIEAALKEIAQYKARIAELEDYLAQATQALKEADEHIRMLEAERRE